MTTFPDDPINKKDQGLESFLNQKKIRAKRWKDPVSEGLGFDVFIDYPDAETNNFIHEFYDVNKTIYKWLFDNTTIPDEAGFFCFLYEKLEFILLHVTEEEPILKELDIVDFLPPEQCFFLNSLEYLISSLNGSPVSDFPMHVIKPKSLNLAWINQKIIDLIEDRFMFHEDYVFIHMERIYGYRTRFERDMRLRQANSIINYDTKGEAAASRSESIKLMLTEYGFFKLEKVRCLKPGSIDRLISLMITNGAPYFVAMFKYLDFLKHLSYEYGFTQYKIAQILGKSFGVSQEQVKKNHNVLNGTKSTEMKRRYTAWQHLDSVKKDYQDLK